MGTITTGVGLISGINTAQLIDSLIAIEARGRDLLQQQIGELQREKTAFLDINARLLNLLSASGTFRSDLLFKASTATSNNEDVLTASASNGAAPGSYTFVVKQLVATSQQLTKGFIDQNTTPVGLETLEFELGQAALSVDTDLATLNGANGVDRGKISITDKNDATAEIDLSEATTLNEVISAINSNTTISVTASIEGDHLVLTDTTGENGDLVVANVGNDTTATDLGIAGSSGSGVGNTTITGTDINTVGLETTLESLNDGLGVLTTNFAADIRITARDGTTFDVDFGRTDQAITTSSSLSNFNDGEGVTISSDSGTTDLVIVGTDGTTYNINLTDVTTVGELQTRIDEETSLNIALTIESDNTLKLTDTDGTDTQAITVSGSAAADLGFDGVTASPDDEIVSSTIPNSVAGAPAQTLEDIINRINNTAENGGRVVASIDSGGLGLLLTDTTGSTASNLIVETTAANGYAASQLGIEQDVAANTITGTRLLASLNSVSTSRLNGGSGLGAASTLRITDRAGTSTVLNSVGSYTSLSDLIDAFNTQAEVDANGARLSVDPGGTRLLITDSSGGSGNLSVSGDAEDVLGLTTGGVAANTFRGTNLQKQYVHNSSHLDDLNYGRGIGIGRFTITDGLGNTATIDINGTERTLQDVINEINAQAGTGGLRVLASVNANGDGLQIAEALEVGDNPFTTIRVTNNSGTAARDLNILQTAENIGDSIDGTYQQSIDVENTDTLDDIVQKINESGIPIAASVVNTGSGPTPYRLNITSEVTGKKGELYVESGSFDLGITKISRGRDAKVFFGDADPADAFLLTNSSNTFAGIATGLSINLVQASDSPVTVTVDRDTASIVEGVGRFVTTFNDVVQTIDRYDFFNVDTEARGALLGNSTTSRIRNTLLSTVQQRVEGVGTQFQFLSEVGIRIGSEGQLQFDRDRFNQAYASDSLAVENLFAAFEQSTSSTTEIAPGVTVPTSTSTTTTRGFGDIFKDLADELTNSIDGTLTTVGDNIDSRIDVLESRVEDFDERLDARRLRLEREFAAMERALAQLQGQSSALSALASNVALQQSLGARSSS